MKIAGIAGAGVAIRFEAPSLFQSASASVRSPQTALDGSTLSQFVSPLPTFAGKRVSGSSLQVYMYEFQQNVLPDSFYTSLSGTFHNGTWLWGYATGPLGTYPSPHWPGLTVEAHKGTATTIRYTNDLPQNSNLQKDLTMDQTIHWANPLNSPMSFSPYTGPVPTVVHLHGGEDQ